jgi:hypothetical protein
MQIHDWIIVGSFILVYAVASLLMMFFFVWRERDRQSRVCELYFAELKRKRDMDLRMALITKCPGDIELRCFLRKGDEFELSYLLIQKALAAWRK